MSEILLFSAGLDSFPAWHRLGKPPALYFDIRHHFRDQELASVQALATRHQMDLTISGELDLSAWDTPQGDTRTGRPANAASIALIRANASGLLSAVWSPLTPTHQITSARNAASMIPGVLLSHALGCRDLRDLSLVHTRADGINAAKTSHPVLSNPGSAGDVRGRDVLLVDDVAGTGETALTAVTMISDHGAARTRIAVCAVNTRNRNPAAPSPGECLDYIGGHYRGWVVFPWERQ